MKLILRKSFVFATLFVTCAASLVAQDIPLRNWEVPSSSARRIAANAALSGSTQFIPVTPCRAYDSRVGKGGPGPIGSGSSRTINIPASACGVPATSVAYSLNIVVTGSAIGETFQFLVAYPTGSARPSAATLNFKAGSQTGNAAIVPAGTGGSIDIYTSLQTEVIVDINGYFALSSVGNSFPSSGSVGIGTPTPAATLQVVGDLRVGTNGTNTDVRIFTDTPQTLGGTAYSQVTSISPVTVPASGTTRAALYLKSATAGGAGTNQIDLVVDGNIAAKYQDLAELVPSTEALAAGTVVILDAENLTFVRPSDRPYDTAVAGVISAQPGITLGIPSEGTVKVATTGRVKVRADATRAAIRVGDLLVTGTKKGTAMKSEAVVVDGVSFHRPGTIIGKAIEPLERGEGEILILLSLQ